MPTFPSFQRVLLPALLVSTALTSCAPPPAPDSRPPQAVPDVQSRGAPKRVVGMVIGEHPQLISKFERALQGAEALEAAVASGLSVKDHRGVLVPQLAESVPSIGNGLWRLSPDGHMQTTWNIRKNAAWHDGTPFTTDDILFTARVGQEEGAVSNFRQDGGTLIEGIDVNGPHSFTVRWNSPFISADNLFSNDLEGTSVLFPLPRHLLERQWNENKDGFSQIPYWSEEFVGTGPYRLKEWSRGVRVVLTAFDNFVLGRPKIDEIEVRFIADSNTAIANLLAGSADLILGRGASLEQAADTQGLWPQGHVDNIGLRSRFALYPQFINPNPAVLGNVQFRKALMHALDRQEMADTLQRGLVPVAHTYMGPDNPVYPQIEPQLVKYEYDARKAVQMIEELGYTRGPDGWFRDAAGQRLTMEARATPGDLYDKLLEVVRDYWQASGVTTEAVPIPRQRQSDLEYRATRPAFELTRRGTNLRNLASFHGRETPLADSRWIGSNVPRYQNAEWDALVDRYFVTVPIPERAQVLGQIMRHVSEQLNMMHIFYDSEPSLLSNRLVNAYGRGSESSATWNVYEWDLK